MHSTIVYWLYLVSGPRLSTQSMNSQEVEYLHLKSLCDRLSEVEKNLEIHSPLSPSWADEGTKPRKVDDISSRSIRDQA